MALANKNNVTKRSELNRAMSHTEADTNFQELINVITDLENQNSATDPFPQYQLRVKYNKSGTRPPNANDDSNQGYEVGSLWFDTESEEVYRCMDAASSAAVWVKTTLTLDELGSAASVNIGEGDDEIRTNIQNQDFIEEQSKQNAIRFAIALG